MLAFIELTYEARSRFSNESTRELYNEFRERFPTFQLPEWKEEDEKRPYSYISEQVLIELEDDGVWLNQHGFEFTVKRFKGAYYTDASRPRHRSSIDPADQPGATYIQIAIPDFALLRISEVQVIEDACTNELQCELNDGWRIIAVCPPNSQRRPDYILGRSRGVGK